MDALSRPLISSVTASCYPVHSARLPRWIGPPQVYCTTPAQLRFFDLASTSCIPGLEILLYPGGGTISCALVSVTGTLYKPSVSVCLTGSDQALRQTDLQGVIAPGSRTGFFCRNRRIVLKYSNPSRISFACLVGVTKLRITAAVPVTLSRR